MVYAGPAISERYDRHPWQRIKEVALALVANAIRAAAGGSGPQTGHRTRLMVYLQRAFDARNPCKRIGRRGQI